MLKINKKQGIIIGFAVLLILAIGISAYLTIGKAPVKIYYFYENACGSCNAEGEFYNFFSETVGHMTNEEYEIKTVNTFKDGNELYNQICEEQNVPEDERDNTMLFIGDSYIAKSDEIKRLLRVVFCREFGIADDKTAVYYHRPDCGDCAKVAPIVEAKADEYSNINFVKIDTTPETPKQDFKDLLKELKIPEDTWEVPFLYYNGKYLLGDEDIAQNIDSLLQDKS